MNTMTRESLIKALEIIRTKSLCCYNNPDFCDCKFGMADAPDVLTQNMGTGEQTGCCEMRLAVGVFRSMTDKEYEKIIRRGQKINAKAVKAYLKKNPGIILK